MRPASQDKGYSTLRIQNKETQINMDLVNYVINYIINLINIDHY